MSDPHAKKTWAQLKAEGVRRCQAVHVGGAQCRRRANAEGSWCSKHAPWFVAYDEQTARLADRGEVGE